MPPERPLRFPAPHLDEYRLDFARERRAAAGRLLEHRVRRVARGLRSRRPHARLDAVRALRHLAFLREPLLRVVAAIGCEYLRRPPADADEPVRAAVQHLVADCCRTRPASPVLLDLTGATLLDLDLAGCVIRDLHCPGARFLGRTDLSYAEVTGTTDLGGARFTGDAVFSDVRLRGDARFTGAVFAAAANFSRAHFAGAARFDGVTFTGPGAWFHRARFAAAVDFRGATPLERADFAGVEFNGDHGDRFAAAVVHAVDSALATQLARLTSTDHAVQGEALAALNRIGIAHPRCRGAVVSAICAHLRRTTDRRAVAVLRDHLHFATPDGFWSDIDLDLSGGTFTDLDLSGVGVNRFHAAGATFTGHTRLDHLDADTLDLRGAVFHGTASLVQVIAEETADLSDTAFHGPADLSRLSVLGPATFARATFAAGAEADEVFLAEGADLTGAVNPPAGLITAAGRPGT